MDGLFFTSSASKSSFTHDVPKTGPRKDPPENREPKKSKPSNNEVARQRHGRAVLINVMARREGVNTYYQHLFIVS